MKEIAHLLATTRKKPRGRRQKKVKKMNEFYIVYEQECRENIKKEKKNLIEGII